MKTLYTSMVLVCLTLGCCACRQSAQRAGFSGPKTDCAVMDATDASEAARENSELGRKLRQLIKEWDEHFCSPNVGASANMTDLLDCEAYLKMVRLGRPLLPLIIEEMKGGHGWLFCVAMDITGLTPGDIEQELGISFEGNINYLYVLWWEIKGREACQVDPAPGNTGKIDLTQLTSYRWMTTDDWTPRDGPGQIRTTIPGD